MTPQDVEARRHALDLDEEGWAGTILIEPLTAIAGGIIGGALVSAAAWRLAWARERTPLYVRVRQARRLLRR